MIARLLIAASLIVAPALAQDNALSGAVENCMAEQSRLDRLDCYDEIGPAFGLSAVESAWRLEERPGDMPEVIVSLEAVRGRAAFDRPILLVARCRNDTTELFIHWNQFLGSDGGTLPDLWKTVEIALDDGATELGEWPLSDVQEATFTPDWGGTLIRRLAAAERLTARITPYDGTPLEAEFTLAGLEAAIGPLTQACGWQLTP